MTRPRTLCAGGAILALLVSVSPLLAGQRADDGEGGGLRFEIRFGPKQSADALDGRMLLMLSTDDSKEPRFQIVDGPATQLAFGIDDHKPRRDEVQRGEACSAASLRFAVFMRVEYDAPNAYSSRCGQE